MPSLPSDRCTCTHHRDAHYLTPDGDRSHTEPCGRCDCTRFQETK